MQEETENNIKYGDIQWDDAQWAHVQREEMVF